MKLDKLNMKLVVLIGAVIILVLTLVFIITQTNLIVNHKKKSEEEKKPEEVVISEEVKNRTKDVNQLTAEEKKYIIKENFLSHLSELEQTIIDEYKEKCIENSECDEGIDNYLKYVEVTADEASGGNYWIMIPGCSGQIYFKYKDNDAVINMDKVTCTGPSGDSNSNSNSSENSNSNNPSNSNSNEKPSEDNSPISEDVMNRTKPAAQLTPREKTAIIVDNVLYDLATADDRNLEWYRKNCLKDDTCAQSVNNNLRYSNATAGYVISGCTGNVSIKYVDDGYYQSTSATSGALKVVANNARTSSKEIRLQDVTPYKSTPAVKVGDYVIRGKFVTDTSQVTCTNG